MAGILHIDSERGWRGGQQQALYLLEGLIEKGHHSAIVCQPGSAIEEYCIRKGLPFYPIRMHGEIGILAGYRISEICKEKGFDILHLHSAHALATGVWTKLFFKKLILVGVRRVSRHIKKNPLSRFKYMTKMVNHHVCISSNIKEVMLADGVSREKISVIHSGVDINKNRDVFPPEDFKKSLGIPEDNVIIGTVAALTREKNYPGLLLAAKSVLSENNKITFCAVGSGPDEDEIKNYARELGIEDKFLFTGYRKDVGCFLKLFDVFVLASLNEGLGTSLLDAQACQLPLVGSDVGGIPEIIKNGKNGFLVPAGDSKALAKALLDLAENREKCREFGRQGLANVQQFDITETVSKNIELYNKLR